MGKSLFKIGAALLGAALFSFVSLQAVFAYVSLGSPKGYVSDYANVLTIEQKAGLEQKLSDFEKTSAVQVAVVTVKNLSGDYIENYAEKLFAEWGIGDKEKDSGVLLLIAVEDRKLRIEVGYGLEGTFTDGQAGAIIRNDITPSFKDGKYFAGISKGVESIMQATKGEYVGTGNTEDSGTSFPSDGFAIVIFFGFVALQFLTSILGRSKSWWLGGVLGAGTGGIIMFLNLFALSLFWGAVVAGGLTLVGLVFDYIVSSAYTQARARGISNPWWIGGGGSSGGSSFGGFGGGSSGGGGASGSW
ncbi:MAG: TPM domain-containing protein [Patescibacteria group bacterium]